MTERAQRVAARGFWPENSGTTSMPRRRAAEITQRNQTSELGAWRCVGSNSLIVVEDQWCPGGESNPHEEKSPEDFKSSASAIPPPGHSVGKGFTCFIRRALGLNLYLTQASQKLRAALRAASFQGTA